MGAGGLRVRGARITRRLPSLRLESHRPARLRHPFSVTQVTRGLSLRRLRFPRDTLLARALHQHRVVGVLPRITGCAVVGNVVFERIFARGTGRAPGRQRVSFLPHRASGTLDVFVRPGREVGGRLENVQVLPPFQHLSLRAGRQTFSIQENGYKPVLSTHAAGQTDRADVKLAQTDPGKRFRVRKHDAHLDHKTSLPHARHLIRVAKVGIERECAIEHRIHVFRLRGVPQIDARPAEDFRAGEHVGHGGRGRCVPLGQIA